MSIVYPQLVIPVGVLIERIKGTSVWVDHSWRPIGVLTGVPETPLWTQLSNDGTRAVFYAGAVDIELYRTETPYYRDNLASGAPLLWIALGATGSEPPYRVSMVTADPAEGEALTETATLLVESVPMPDAIQERVAAFVAEHHIEQSFVKRQRDRADPEALARRPPQPGKSVKSHE